MKKLNVIIQREIVHEYPRLFVKDFFHNNKENFRSICLDYMISVSKKFAGCT